MAKTTASKKQRRQVVRKPVKKKTGPAQTAAIPTPLAVLTRVKIDKNGNVPHPDTVISLQTGPIVWLVFNQSSVDHTVTIDPNKFFDASTHQPDNPLNTENLISRSVPAKQKRVLIGVIRDDADQISYGYDITMKNQITGALVKAIDPDLDVVDPKP